MKRFWFALVLGSLGGWLAAPGLWGPAKPSHDLGSPAAAGSVLPTSRGGEGHLALPALDELRGPRGMEAFLGRMEAAGEADFSRWLRELKADAQRGPYRFRLMELIVKRWTARDPAAVLRFLTKEDLPYERLVLSEWAKKDPAAAIAAALKLDPHGNRVGDMLGELDLERRQGVYEHLLASGFDRHYPNAFESLLVAVYDLDPSSAATSALERAFARSRNLPFGPSRALGEILQKWIQDDRESALAWARHHTDRKIRRAALQQLAVAWVKEDALAGLESCWSELDHEQRSWLVNELDEVVPEDVEALFSWVNHQVTSPELHGRMVGAIIRGLRRSDTPEKMAELLPHLLRDGGRLEWVVEPTATQWAKKDPDGLKQWAETLEDERLQAVAMVAWLSTVEPLVALEHLESIWGEGARSVHRNRDLLETIVSRLAGDPEVSLEEVFEGLPAPIRDAAAMGYATSQSYQRSRPEATVAFLEKQPEGKERNRALQYTVGGWAAKDPVNAAEWVGTLEESPHKAVVVQNLVHNWARQDLNAAASWVEEQVPSLSRDKALAKVIDAARSHDPERAVAWAQGIGDEEVRDEWLGHALRSYAYEDPRRASVLLGQSELSEEAAAKIAAEIAQAEAFQRLGRRGEER